MLNLHKIVTLKNTAMVLTLVTGLYGLAADQSQAATYELTQTLMEPQFNGGGDSFGQIIALDGNTALSNGGRVTANVYTFDTNTGQLLRTFARPTAPNPLANFDINAIAADGNETLIGSYLFDNATGNLEQVFEAPSPQARFNFAGSAALSKDRVLVGVRPTISGGPSENDAVYLFDRNTGALLQTFPNPSIGTSNNFGGSVALNEN
ncbi:MAG: hypothetical protein AAGC54_15505, partial [Cyanobacteria bacterium P01_F01_bin.4]